MLRGLPFMQFSSAA